MRGNFNFTNQEDAQRLIENEGGQLHDNRHSSNEWEDNHFTVQITDDNAKSYEEQVRNG